MEKKRKTELPEPESEKQEPYERTESRKRLKGTKEDHLDVLFEGIDSRDKQPQDLPIKEADCSEGNVKAKTGLGTKRTKKPPKSLENFICRPTVRTFQRPGSEIGRIHARGRDGRSDKTKGSLQLHRSDRKKCNSDSVTKGNSAVTKTDQSALSSSSLRSSSIMSPAANSSNTTAKKVLPKQTKKTELKADLTARKPQDAILPQSTTKLSASHKKALSTPIKQTYFPKPPPTSSSASQKDSSPQEGLSILSEGNLQQDPASSNVRDKNPNKTCFYTISHDENAVSPKPTPCLLENVLQYSEGRSEMSSNLYLSRIESESCSEDSINSSIGDFRTITNQEKKHQNGCIHVLPANGNSASIQQTGFLSTNKCTLDLIEKSKGRKQSNESKDLNCTSEQTMKSIPKNPALEQKKDDCSSEHGMKGKDCLEQVKANCLTDTSNTQLTAASVKPYMDGKSSNLKLDKKPAKKKKVSHLVSKIAKMTKNHSPVSLLKGGSQKKIPCLETSEVLSSSQCKQIKSKPAQSSNQVSLLLKPEFKKRGRPKMNKLKPPLLQEKNLQLTFINSPNNQNSPGPDTELDIKQTKPTVRKRGRPVNAQQTQPASISEKHHSRDPHMPSKAKDVQISEKSKSIVMKTIIKKINNMRVKKKDQVLTQILLGQKQCDTRHFSQEPSKIDLSSSVSPATDSLSSLVSSFGGKLGRQINVSKRGTIYMGKRRGRKPKSQTNSNQAFNQVSSLNSQQISPDTSQFEVQSDSVQKSSDTPSGLLFGSSCSANNVSSSLSCWTSSQIKFSNQKIKSASFTQQGDHLNSKPYGEATFTCQSEDETNDNTTSDKSEKNSRMEAATEFGSTGSALTMSAVSGSRPKAFSSLPSERTFSTFSPVSHRSQDSSQTHITSPLLTLTDQEAQKFKCHRKVHHCFDHEKIRRHKYKCKKKYMQLKAKRHDPDFLAEVEDLIVRLSKVHIVQHITRTRSCDNGGNAGRKTTKGKSKSYDIQCLQEKVHPPTMFQINLSGYYSPQSSVSYEPLQYVRMANMRKKRGCSSEPSEQQMAHFPVMHKLEYPPEFIHPAYKVPFTSLGFGLYRGYPSATLYPVAFPPSYMHHYSKNPIISPSKFHKKRAKFPSQNPILWGQNSSATFSRMMHHSSCGRVNSEVWQSEKQKEKSKGRREEHSRMAQRQHGIQECQWCNNPTKDNGNSDYSSFTFPSSSSSTFSQIQTADKTFLPTNQSNQKQVEEVRWSENHSPLGLGNGNLNQEFKSRVNEDTLEEPEPGNCMSPQQTQGKKLCFLKQPKFFSNTQSRKRISKSGKGNQVSGDSHVLMERVDPTVQDDSTGNRRPAGTDPAGHPQFPRKHQHSDCLSSREPVTTQWEPSRQKSHKRRLIEDANDQDDQTSPDTHLTVRHTASTSGKLRHITTLRHFNSQETEVTAGNRVKRRGPGRPRKNPELTYPPSPPSTPELASFPTEQKDKAEKVDIDNRDTVLEVIELVIHGEQRSPNETSNARTNVGLKQNKEKDGVEKYSDSHLCSASLDPSPGKEASVSLASKKYLWAGLYSDVYKTENSSDQPQQLNTGCLDYNPEEHPHGLLPAPLHVGRYLRLKRIDFRLPYDIHWLCAHNKLFENPVTPTEATIANSPCTPPNSSVPHCSADDGLGTTFPDIENQSKDTGSPTQLHDETQPCHQLLTQQEENIDNENFPSPLSNEERSFVMKHGVFLMRNYEKMKARQALLLRGRVLVQEKEKDEDNTSGQSEDKGTGEDQTFKSDRCQIEKRLCSEDEEHLTCQSQKLAHILQEIWDRILSCKGSSGQILSDPLLNLCSRKRPDSALMDLNMVEKQLLSGYYESLETFHSDMLMVFHCAEKYYGSESAVGHDVCQLRAIYNRSHQKALANFL